MTEGNKTGARTPKSFAQSFCKGSSDVTTIYHENLVRWMVESCALDVVRK